MSRARSAVDRGFTLIEGVICISLMGILATVVSSAIVVTLRSSPAVADRADAAVNVQGLVTWLPQDVDSAAPGSFTTDPAAQTGCSLPDNGQNLLKMAWSETITSTVNYAASYRYVNEPDGGHIERVYCVVGQPPHVLKVSGLLPPWVALAEPVTVTIEAPVAPKVLTDTVTFEVEPLVGKTIVVKATTKNLNENLPTGPTPTTTPPATTLPPNLPPVADDIALTINSAVAVPVTVTGTDPEGLALTANFPAPPGWTVVPSGPMTFVVTAPISADGTTVVAPYTVTDVAGNVDGANVTFTVMPTGADLPPDASPSSGSTTAGGTVVVALAASDPEGLPLTAVVNNVPAGWTATVAGLNVTVVAPIDAATATFTMDYVVTDSQGATDASTIAIQVTGPPPCVITTPTVTPGTMKLKHNNPDALTNTVTVSITIVSGYCVGLALHYETGAPNGQYVRNFGDIGTTRTVTLPKHNSPELWSTGTKILEVKDSSATVIGTSTLVVTT